MTGIFDSGVGGLTAYSELRRLLPREDIIYLADRKNAPYGTKTKDELVALTKKDIERLSLMGAKRILIACCTASTVYGELDEWERKIATPIITPASRLAARGQRILVIATEHTVASGAFRREINRFSPDASVFESAEQGLVSLVESGNRDGCVGKECLSLLLRISERARELRADTLVLGCTHFSHLHQTLSAMLKNLKIISPAKEGAREIARQIMKTSAAPENGRTVYT